MGAFIPQSPCLGTRPQTPSPLRDRHTFLLSQIKQSYAEVDRQVSLLSLTAFSSLLAMGKRWGFHPPIPLPGDSSSDPFSASRHAKASLHASSQAGFYWIQITSSSPRSAPASDESADAADMPAHTCRTFYTPSPVRLHPYSSTKIQEKARCCTSCSRS